MPKTYPKEFLQRYDWSTAKKICKGTSGSVYKVQHVRTGETRAVKVMRASSAKRLDIELELLSLLKHPHVLRYYESFRNQHYVLIVTEYCKDGDLFDYLKRSPNPYIDEADAKRLAAQLLSALQYCHASLVAHRDIKLDNVFLSEGQVKLGDFGFSRTCDPLDRSNTFCGSPWYVAPEIALGAQYQPYLADVWSFGVLLAALCLGRFPFGSKKKSPAALLEDMLLSSELGTEFELAQRIDDSRVSSELEDLLKQLLQVEPTKRPRVDRIQTHPWFTGVRIDAHLPLRSPAASISRELVERVATLGFAVQEVWQGVIDNDCTLQCVAIYHLLQERLNDAHGRKQRYRNSRAFSESELLGMGVTRTADAQEQDAPPTAPHTPPRMLRKILTRNARRKKHPL